MDDLVPTDPVEALMAAHRDNLLVYHGFVAGGFYEVESGGRRWTLTGPDVLAQVGRLRAIERISEIGGAARVTEILEDGTHVFRIGRRQVELPAAEVVPWYRGFSAAHEGNGQQHTGADNIAEIQDVFEHEPVPGQRARRQPSLANRRRMVLLGLMYGGEREIGSERLAGMIADTDQPIPAKKTVLNAINFSRGLSDAVADRLIAPFGLRWQGPDSADVVQADGSPVDGPLPEMASLAFLRGVVQASKQRLLRYNGKPSINEVRWATRFALSVGRQQYVVAVADGPVWLDGLSAYHGIVRRRHA